MNSNKHLCLLGYFFLLAFLPISLAQNDICDHPDYPALVAFYNATNGTDWTEKWDLSDCQVCDWFGVSCNQQNRVTGITLDENGLTGMIPTEIGSLNFLRVLILDNNLLTGQLPSSIGNLTNLSVLLLNDNNLSGSLPPQIGDLAEIEFLSFTNNQIEGAIPPEYAGIGISTLVPVQIRMNNNLLSGCFPSSLKTWCSSLPPIKFYTIDLLNNPDLPNGGNFSPFCNNDEGICPVASTNNCEDLQFLGQNEQITVSGLTLLSKVEIIGQNTDYQTIIICEDDCTEVQIIPNLSKGRYTVKVNLFDGENYCYKETSVMVDGDNNTGNEKADCGNLVFIGGNEQITIEGLTAQTNKVEILGRNTEWQVIPICSGDCYPTLVIPDLAAGEYAVKINQSGSDGSYCYREEKVLVEGQSNIVGSVNCDDLLFSSSNDTIIIDGLTASYNKVEILGRNTDWQVLTICDGDCLDKQIIPDLADGEYTVKINQGGSDGSYCYREEKIIIENNNNSRNSIADFSGNLVVYPNPARDRINIQLPNIALQKGMIHIYNFFGQHILATSINELNQNILTIDLNGFENGIYWMVIQINDSPQISQRFIVEHLR